MSKGEYFAEYPNSYSDGYGSDYNRAIVECVANMKVQQ